jgi:hypothetical protein
MARQPCVQNGAAPGKAPTLLAGARKTRVRKCRPPSCRGPPPFGRQRTSVLSHEWWAWPWEKTTLASWLQAPPHSPPSLRVIRLSPKTLETAGCPGCSLGGCSQPLERRAIEAQRLTPSPGAGTCGSLPGLPHRFRRDMGGCHAKACHEVGLRLGRTH